jgi:hypothetical protein
MGKRLRFDQIRFALSKPLEDKGSDDACDGSGRRDGYEVRLPDGDRRKQKSLDGLKERHEAQSGQHSNREEEPAPALNGSRALASTSAGKGIMHASSYASRLIEGPSSCLHRLPDAKGRAAPVSLENYIGAVSRYGPRLLLYSSLERIPVSGCNISLSVLIKCLTVTPG